MKRTVIYVVESGGLCGGVRVIYEHLNRLRARGWHVEVYSLDSKRPNWFPLHPGIPWWRFDSYDHLTMHLSQRDAIKVATWWKTAFPVAESSKPGEGFYLVQDIETSYYLSPKQREVVLQSYELGLTQYTTSRWVEENLEHTHYVGIGIDHTLYRTLEENRQVNAILSLPRPQLLKGWSTHCEAYRKLHHTKEFRLYSFGVMGVHPPYSSSLGQLSDEDLIKWYNRTGIFLSSSWHEGFSLTLLEAMACGAVVVASDAHGNMQFCRNRENCLIVPRGDADALVNACLELLNNINLLIDLQSAGFETAAQWEWDPVIDRLEGLYAG